MKAARKAELVPRPLAPRWLAALCYVVLVATVLPNHSWAQDSRGSAASGSDKATEPPEAAVAHYKKGRELYLAGRYREAVGELEQAVRLDPDSLNLVYNLARVYELLGEIDTSIRHYKRYRDLLPENEVEERERVTGTLQRLEGARVHVPAEEPQMHPAPGPVKLERGVADATFWTFTAASVATLVAGSIVGVMALDASKDAKAFVLEGENGVIERNAKDRRANRMALGSDLCLLAGAVLGTTAILLFALRHKPAQPPPWAALDIEAGPKGASLVLRGNL